MGSRAFLKPLVLAVSTSAGLACGWSWPHLSPSTRHPGAGSMKPDTQVQSGARVASAAAASASARTAIESADFGAFMEALEWASAEEIPALWRTCSASFPAPSRWHEALLDRWAEEAPETGLRFLTMIDTDETTRNDLVAALFTSWTAYRPVEAMAALAELPEGNPRRSSLAGAMRAVLVAEHPELFLVQAATVKTAFPKDFDYDYWAPQAAAQLAISDPEHAVAVVNTAAGLDRTSVRLGLVFGWAARDPAAAEAWVATWPQRSQDSGRMRIAGALAFQDPEATGRLLSQITTFAFPIDSDKAPAGELGRYTWPMGHQDPLRTILTRMLREDPCEAMAWTRRHLPAQADYQIARRLTWDWPASLETALNTLTRLDGTALAETAKAGGLAIHEPRFAEQLDELAARFPADQRDAGRTVLLASAARVDPEAAVPRLLDLPATPERDRVLENAFTRWADRAPEAATSWLGALPSGMLRDRLVWKSIEYTASVDPPAAWEWLMTTAESRERTQCYDEALAAWARSDAAAARAALGSLKVDDTTRRYLADVVEEHSR